VPQSITVFGVQPGTTYSKASHLDARSNAGLQKFGMITYTSADKSMTQRYIP
jgi:hypothetical protein